MFFTYFNQILSPGVDMNLTLSKTQSGELVVILLPKVNGLRDDARHRIGPLRLSGTPQELDREFFPSITAPVQKTSGILMNMAEYEKQQAAASAESKAAKDQKEKQSKEAKEKKEKYDICLKKAGELEAAGNPDGALEQLRQARQQATDKALKTVDEKIAALKAKAGMGSLFEAPPVPQAAAPAPTPAPVQPAQNFGMFGPPAADTSPSRAEEYPEIVDFPSGMRPPVYSGQTGAGAI